MFAAYKGFRIVEEPDSRAFEVKDPHGHTLGHYPSMSAAVQAINQFLRTPTSRAAS